MQFILEEPEEIQIRESRGLVKDIYDPSIRVREPLSEYRTFLDLIHRDQTLASAFRIIVNFATYRGFDFIDGTKPERDSLRKLFDDLNFQQVLPNLMYTLCYYGDGFLELRRNNSKSINELWPLETTEMRIMYDEHGKVHGYVQRPFSITGMSEKDVLAKELEKLPEEEGGDGEKTRGVFFDKDEVLHFRMKWIGSQVYSYNPNEPISTIASTALYANNYLMNIFMNMPPRYVAHLAGISNSDFKIAKREFQSTKTNYKKTIAFTKSSDPMSKLTFNEIKPPYDETLIKIMKWVHNEMLKITGVPRSWIEESGTENRGVTEAEQRPFDVLIMSIHRCVLEPTINKELLPKIKSAKKAKSRLRFNEISRKGEKEILENANMLMNFGVKPEAMIRYLDERGILGFDEKDFDMKRLNPAPINDTSSPSRKPMNKSTSDMTQNRNEAGVSDKSGKKMGVA